MAMTPQTYPLWCAVLNPDGTITTGRVVGWTHVEPDKARGFVALPVVAVEGEFGRVARIGSPPTGGSEMFIRDTHGGATQAAANYTSEVRRAARTAEHLADRANRKH